MYKDIETDGMKVACSVEEKCSGDKLMPPPPPAPAKPIDQTIAPKSVKKPSEQARHKAKGALPKKMPPPSITPEEVQQTVAPLTEQNTEEGGFGDLSSDEGFVDPTSIYQGGRKKKKKKRKKRSRSKKRRNKRKNRTKKN